MGNRALGGGSGGHTAGAFAGIQWVLGIFWVQTAVRGSSRGSVHASNRPRSEHSYHCIAVRQLDAWAEDAYNPHLEGLNWMHGNVRIVRQRLDACALAAFALPLERSGIGVWGVHWVITLCAPYGDGVRGLYTPIWAPKGPCGGVIQRGHSGYVPKWGICTCSPYQEDAYISAYAHACVHMHHLQGVLRAQKGV